MWTLHLSNFSEQQEQQEQQEQEEDEQQHNQQHEQQDQRQKQQELQASSIGGEKIGGNGKLFILYLCFDLFGIWILLSIKHEL